MDDDSINEFGFLNLAVLVLSVYVQGALIISTAFKLSDETFKLLNYIDICIFFFVEFYIRFNQSENKLKFMHWGWIDLVSIIPRFSCWRRTMY